jgi:hypothetical protein
MTAAGLPQWCAPGSLVVWDWDRVGDLVVMRVTETSFLHGTIRVRYYVKGTNIVTTGVATFEQARAHAQPLLTPLTIVSSPRP